MRLALADGQLQSVAQRDHPALTGECAHLPDVVDIHDRIPMNSLELWCSQALFDHSQRLGCKQPPFRGNNPNQFPLRLKGQHVVTVQEEILLTAASHDLCAPGRVGWFGGGGDLVDTRGDLGRFPLQVSGALHGNPQSRFADGFQQIVDGPGFERLNRVLVISGYDHDNGEWGLAEVPDHFKPAHYRHLQIEKDNVRTEARDLLPSISTVSGLADDQDSRQQFQFFAKDAPRDRLVVNDQGFHHMRLHLLHVSGTSARILNNNCDWRFNGDQRAELPYGRSSMDRGPPPDQNAMPSVARYDRGSTKCVPEQVERKLYTATLLVMLNASRRSVQIG